MKTFKNLTALFTISIFSIMLTSCEKENFQPVAPSQFVENTFASTSINQNETGCNLLPASEYNKLPKAPAITCTQTLPVTFSLQCPDVKSQGQEKSCVSWATAYAARSILARNNTGGAFSNSTNVFSPEYVFNQIKVGGDCAHGSFIPDALNLMMLEGVCTLSKMPINTNDCSTQPNTTQKNNAAQHKILLYGTVPISASEIKNRLYAGYPVIVGGPVDRNFYSNSGDVIDSYSPLPSDYIGLHAYCVVGWDANKDAFKVMNSWGTDWKSSGFAWVKYNMISTFFQEAYTMYAL